MQFNSLQYALFLPVVVVVHWLLPQRLRLAWLLGASYLFYGAWDWRFLGLILISTAVDYLVGRSLDGTDAPSRRRRLVAASVLVNLGILATFKYFDFFIGSAADLLRAAGLEPNEPTLRVVLPVGISFYTFQTMGYSIDVFRRRLPACRDPLLFATYVAFFPQLVAGPIERAPRLLPQLAADRPAPKPAQVESALLLILTGLFKKVVIGDSMAPIVDEVFSDPAGFGSIGLAVAVVGFAIQIYADFCGYTDIARGSARLFGIELMENFRQPYLSTSIGEFWRRWHISLSTWLRDYLYVPLGGNRRGPSRTATNLMLTMLLGGLWHGAAWTFVVWGGLHGSFLVAQRVLARSRAPLGSARERSPLRTLWATGATFSLVCGAWVFFRAESFDDALAVLGGLLTASAGAMPADASLVAVMGLATLALDLASRARTTRGWRPERSALVTGLYVGTVLVALLVYSGQEPVPFVYFQF